MPLRALRVLAVNAATAEFSQEFSSETKREIPAPFFLRHLPNSLLPGIRHRFWLVGKSCARTTGAAWQVSLDGRVVPQV